MPFAVTVTCKTDVGTYRAYHLNSIAHYRATSCAIDFYEWISNVAQQMCYHCGDDHSSLCCPDEKCHACGTYGHWGFVCPCPDYAVENPYFAAMDAEMEERCASEDDDLADNGVAVVYPILDSDELYC